MLRYLIRRLLLTIPVLLGVATLVFALIHLVPGDPAQSMLGEGASVEEVAKLRHALGLDRPLLAQYQAFLTGLVKGDLGTSFRYGTPVTREIRDRLFRTVQLAAAAMAVAIRLRAAARHRRRRVSRHRHRSRGDDARARRHLDAELLARSAARDSVRRLSRLAAGCRHRDDLAPRAAGRHARRRARRDPRAHDARQPARGAARALRARRPRARAVARPRRRAPRVPQQPHPGRDDHRPAVRRGADRHDHHRDDLRLARRRPAADSGDQLPRLSARAGLHPLHLADLRR